MNLLILHLYGKAFTAFHRKNDNNNYCHYKQRKTLEQKSLACKIINLDLKKLPQLNKLWVHSLHLILVFNGKRTVRFAQSPIQTLCMNVSTLFIWAICVREYGVFVQKFTIQPATMRYVSAILILLTAKRMIGFTRKREKWKNHELGFTQQGNELFT